MPLREETIHFEEEIARLEDKREALADEVAELADSGLAVQQKVQKGQNIDAYLDGLEWAMQAHEDGDVPVWDEDVDTITLAGLTGGEFGGLENELAQAAGDGESAAGAHRVYQVRSGTVEAPYLDSAASKQQQIAAVASLPTGFLKWAEYKVDELSSVGSGRGKNFAELVVEKQQET